jgi:hypothetical protein
MLYAMRLSVALGQLIAPNLRVTQGACEALPQISKLPQTYEATAFFASKLAAIPNSCMD